MASGYGLGGGPSRCFGFWQEVLACYVTNNDEVDPAKKRRCAPVLEDYYECLHHRKEAARVTAMQAAFSEREAKWDRAGAMTGEQVRQLGVLPGPPEEKGMMPLQWVPRVKRN